MKKIRFAFFLYSLAVSFAILPSALLAQNIAAPTEIANPAPISGAMQEYFFGEIRKWNNGLSGNQASGIPFEAAAAFNNIEFQKIRAQLRQAGTKAWPLVPRVADLFSQNTPNAYDLAWIMTESTPVQSSQPSAIAAQIAAYQRGATADERYGSIVRLGKTPDPTALAALIPIAQNPDTKLRLLALIAMGFAGKSNGPLAAGVLGKGLRDTDKINRGVAMNALRLLGPQDALYAVEDIIIFFKTKENVYQSSGVLRSFPVAYLKPLKLDFESILADPKLTAFQKESVVEILLKIENAQ